MAAIENFVLKIKVEGQKAVDDLSKSVTNLGTTVGGFGAAAGKMTSAISGIVGSMGGLLGIAGTAATVFVGLGLKAITLADDLGDISDATGIAAGSLNNFRNSLVDAGGKTEDFSTLASKLNQNIGDAATGNEAAQKAFQKLGVFVRDAGGEVRNTGDVLRDAISKLAAIEDPATRAAMAVDIFGKSAAKLDFTKLNAANDFAKDEQIAQLAKYQTAIDAISKSINNNLLTAFGKIAIAFNNSMKMADEAERRANAQGKTIVRDPRLGTAMEVDMTKKEKERYELQQKLNEAYKDQGREMSRLESLGKTSPVTGDYGAKGEDRIKRERAEAEKLQKELDKQLKTVDNIGNSYILSSQTAQEKLNLQMSTVNMTERERSLYEGIFEINRKANEAIVRLDEQRQGAKGETLKLINSETAAIEKQRNLEIEVFTANQDVLANRKRQQQEIKNIVDLMEQEAVYSREIAEFQNQQGQAVLSAFELVRAQSESLQLTGQREQLEKSIQNLRSTEQATAKELFDLETQRKTQLEAIRRIQNLPFEGVGGMKQRLQEINDLYDQRRAKIEENAAATKIEQDSFASGWKAAGEKYRNNIKTDAEYAAQQLSNFTQGFENAFVKFVQTGKLSFKDLANSMIADFARVQAQKVLSSFMTGGGGGGFLGSLFGGFFANGGSPPMNKVSVVGEKGPELFVPKTAGTIVPNGALGGGQTVNTAVTYNIQAVDAQSFKSLLARDPEFIHNVAEQGRRQLPIRSRR